MPTVKETPALVIAGTHSGSGKTTVVLALLSALHRRGHRVQGFKVGPDFIDAGHHGRITGRPSRNLDTWLLDPPGLAKTYRRGVQGADVAIIEGVMGLFDGRGALDEAGSTADLARLWDLPVALVVDARGLARSIAPLVHGFRTFDERVNVIGTVANRVGSARHYNGYLAPALTALPGGCQPLGFLPRDERLSIPSRHLGLVTTEEFQPDGDFWSRLADAAESFLDVDAFLALARPPRLAPPEDESTRASLARSVRVAVARDRAFCFYYEDNLDLLREAGAELVPFSPLDDPGLPDSVDLVYVGGGYPEVFASQIAANHSFRASIQAYHKQGGAILAECGGLMACAQTLRDGSGHDHAVWGLIPVRVVMKSRFQALGYVTIETENETLLGPQGTSVRGHEFHYSALEPLQPLCYATRLVRSDGAPRPDGIQIGGLLAGYAHLHFGSNPAVVPALLQ